MLLHQRLSIIDLSEAASQPFEDDTAALVYNGEVYNYIELRQELTRAGETFSTTSDTEVLFRAINRWGIDEALQRANGMWALAYLDKRDHTLYLARDRFGVKPLYYRSENGRFTFASELKTVLLLSRSSATLDVEAMGAFLQQALLEHRPSLSWVREIQKVPPGTVIRIDKDGALQPREYFSLAEGPPSEGGQVARKKLAAIVEDSVRIRLRADVPVGVLLSGGLDSSIIAAVAARHAAHPVALLTFKSADPTTDESPAAAQVARHLGLGLTVVQLSSPQVDTVEHLKSLTWQNDGPLHSLTATAYWSLMEAARDHGIKVLLSGQGADEGFCGYRKYWPLYLRAVARDRRYLDAVRVGKDMLRHIGGQGRIKLDEIHRYLRRPAASWAGPALPASGVSLGLARGESIAARQIRDVRFLSVPSLLHYEDRMSMAHSREVRLPFMDYRLMQSGVSLPEEEKLRDGFGKHLLRSAFADLLPDSVAWQRRKRGFGTEERMWLSGAGSAEVRALLGTDSRLFHRGLLGPEAHTLIDRATDPSAPRGQRQVFRFVAAELFLRAFEPFIA